MSSDSLKILAETNRYTNPLDAKVYGLAYYKRAVQEKNNEDIYHATYINALIYSVLEQKDSAHYFIDTSIKESKKQKNQQQYINSLYLKGSIFYDSDMYDQASQLYATVYELIKEGDNIAKLAEVRHSIALVKNQIGLPKQAVAMVKMNLNLYNERVLTIEKYPIEYLNTLLNLSNTYTNLADSFPEDKVQYLDSAQFYNSKGLLKSEVLHDLEGNSIFLTLQAIIQQKKGNFEQALLNFKSAEKQINELGFQNQLSVLYLYEGKNYFLQEDYDNAITYLLKVVEIEAQKETNSPSVQETYILLAKCYEKKNNTEKALKYLKLFEEKDAQNDILIRNVSENIYKQYDIPSFKNKIEKLRNESQREQLKSRRLAYVCLFLSILSVFGFYYYKKREQTQKKRFEAVLEELKIMEETQNAIPEKNKQAYIITDDNVQKILKGLEKFEQKKLFLHKKCTLNYVAKRIHTNSTYLSKTLQSHKQKKFVQYITDLRLNYALKELKNDSKFRTYDIKSIASELGFNTSESFSKAFKKKTGIYPSYYIKNLDILEEEKNI
ncbi:helix-turn-helix domain-containing protein [Kordia sp.]|uniref:helix-turn-helix domain-containing protein n=1 Tax=Kordia sp. TaxID=1965332 RepID=UPI003D2AF8A9